MTQRNLGASIYNDYLAIISLINTYGRDMTRFSIGKLIEVYACIRMQKVIPTFT